MASPTTNKGYTYPSHGGSVNSWDTPIDADFDQIDLNVGGPYQVILSSTIVGVTFNSTNCTASSTANLITFPTSIAQNLYYNVTGASNSSCVLVYPAAGSFYVINNQTSSGPLYAGITGNTANAIPVTGVNLVISDSSNMLSGRPGTEFSGGGTVGIVFAMSAPPSGWTQDTSITGNAVAIISSAATANTSQAGAWGISGLSVGAHTLTINEIPSHNHTYNNSGNNNANRGSGSLSVNQGVGSANTGNAGGGASHTHTSSGDGTWRPAYYMVLRATKN